MISCGLTHTALVPLVSASYSGNRSERIHLLIFRIWSNVVYKSNLKNMLVWSMVFEWPSSTYAADVHQQRAYSHRFSFREEGLVGLSKGWAPTLIGYSFQGLGKFGFYEIFKLFYSGLLGDQNAYSYRTILYLVSSASAEIFADIALAPWEATKVRIQTQDNWASTLRRGLPKLYGNERKN